MFSIPLIRKDVSELLINARVNFYIFACTVFTACVNVENVHVEFSSNVLSRSRSGSKY